MSFAMQNKALQAIVSEAVAVTSRRRQAYQAMLRDITKKSYEKSFTRRVYAEDKGVGQPKKIAQPHSPKEPQFRNEQAVAKPVQYGADEPTSGSSPGASPHDHFDPDARRRVLFQAINQGKTGGTPQGI